MTKYTIWYNFSIDHPVRISICFCMRTYVQNHLKKFLENWQCALIQFSNNAKGWKKVIAEATNMEKMEF